MNQLKATGSYTLLSIATLIIMVGTLVAPGLIGISEALGVADNAILLITLPALGAVLFAPLSGKLIDKFGAYYCVVIGLFLYGFIGASVYWLNGPAAVFTNRVLLGGVTSAVMAGSTVLISQWYTGKARLNMIAKQGMAIEFGGVLFLFVGGILATHYWALPLTLYLLAWVFLIMLFLFVPRNSPAEKVSEMTEQIIKPKALSLKGVYLMALFSMSVFFTAFVLLPVAMHREGYDEQQVGALLASISLVAVVAALFMPKVVKLLGELKVLSVAFICYGIAYFLFLQMAASSLVIGAIICGIGFGFTVPLLNHMTVELSPAKVRGRNLSYFTMAIFSGQFLTSFIEYIPGGINNIWLSGIAFCVLIAIVLFATSNRAAK